MRLPTLVIHSTAHPNGRAFRMHGIIFFLFFSTLFMFFPIPDNGTPSNISGHMGSSGADVQLHLANAAMSSVELMMITTMIACSLVAFFISCVRMKFKPFLVPVPPVSAHQQMRELHQRQLQGRPLSRRMYWTLA